MEVSSADMEVSMVDMVLVDTEVSTELMDLADMAFTTQQLQL